MKILQAFLGALANLEKRALVSVCLTVSLSTRNNSASNGRSFKKFDYLRLFKKFVDKIQDSLKSDRLTGPLHEDLCTFMTSSFSMISVSGSSCRENVDTHFVFDSSFSKIL